METFLLETIGKRPRFAPHEANKLILLEPKEANRTHFRLTSQESKKYLQFFLKYPCKIEINST